MARCVAVCCSVLQCVAIGSTGELCRRRWQGVLRCVAGVLPCVAGCCSLLQFSQRASSGGEDGKVYCSVLPCVAVCCTLLQCVTICSTGELCRQRRQSILNCVTVCCSVLQFVAEWGSVLQDVAACQTGARLVVDDGKMRAK